MSSLEQPKVILFDIGGVCVLSPFQTVLDYELSSGIPPGWINYAISKSSPNGTWHRLERGEIPLDAEFYRSFNADLHVPSHWETFYLRETTRRAKRMKSEKASSGLGPTRDDPSSTDTDPPATAHAPRGVVVPPLPRIDGQRLFNEMMFSSRAPDPWVLPALHALKRSGKYIIAALSNTFIFPQGHPLHAPDFFAEPTRAVFDIFISSAHVGMRKPEPRMYAHALERLNAVAAASGGVEIGGPGKLIRPQDVLFLDDIGENLREARKQGWRTIKVPLGRAFEAVDELERITGLELHGTHPRVAVEPTITMAKAKI